MAGALAASFAVPADWGEAIASILEGGTRRLLVLEPADAGKSSFCRLLLEAASERGRRAVLVDADVGQKCVGPSAAVTRALAKDPAHLDGLAFVGATDPGIGFARILAGLTALLPEAPDGLVVVNTSGLLGGFGRRLKAGKIERLAPALLVAIGAEPGLDAVLADHAALPRLRLGRPPEARRKSSARRRAARRAAFEAHFRDARTHELAWPGPTLGVLPERLLVGVRDEAGRDLALGIIGAIEPERGSVRVLSPATPGTAAGLVPGFALLDESWEARPVAAARPAPG